MAYSVIPKIRRDGTITLKDNGAVTLDVAYEDGTLNFTPAKPEPQDQTIIRDRGTITNVRYGDSQAAATGSFSFHLRQFTDGSEAGSIIDFINKTGFYSANVSTGSTGTPRVEFHCVDIQYLIAGAALGDDADSTVTLTRCVCDISIAEGDPTSVTLNFIAYGLVTYAGPA